MYIFSTTTLKLSISFHMTNPVSKYVVPNFDGLTIFLRNALILGLHRYEKGLGDGGGNSVIEGKNDMNGGV